MRKINIIAVLFLGLAIACQKVDVPATDEGEDCEITFAFAGEISTSESPLTRSGSPNDLYAVQVFKGNENFALGIFDDVQSMKLNLKKGNSYSVRVCLVRNAKILLADYYSLTNNGLRVYNSAVGPFYYAFITRSGSTYYSHDYFLKSNCFNYNSNSSISYYASSSSTSWGTANFGYGSSDERSSLSNIRKGSLLGINYPECSDWFYGEINNYVPNGEKETKSVTLYRTGFRLQYVLEGVTDGEVTVSISNSSRTFFNNTTNTASYTSAEKFIAFYDTYSAWQYADNYTENLNVSVSWKRGIGVTQDLGSKTIQVKRNCLNKVKITLGSDDRGAGVNMSTEAESSMGAVSDVIPVQ